MYAKVFKSMWQGTLGDHWEGWATFVYLLAHCDRSGLVDMTPQAISRGSSLPIDVVRRGLEILESPDPSSRSTDLEGRRLERIDTSRDWGWRIVNYEYYRNLRDSETVREQTLERVTRHRVTRCNAVKRSVTHGNAMQKQRHMQKQETKDLASGEAESGFDQFYKDYPRKVGKQEALKAWRSQKILDQKELDRVMSGLRLWKEKEWAGREQQFIPHPATWLRGRRWNDDPGSGVPIPPAVLNGSSDSVGRQRGIEEQRAKFDRWRAEKEAELAGGGS